MNKRIHIEKGLNLPISGTPVQTISPAAAPLTTVALVGEDYPGLKPTMIVQAGDLVKKGELLFIDKNTEGVRYTAPAAGKVVAINRGAKRKFESLVIELQGEDEVTFECYRDDNLARLERQQVRDNLVASGLWTALRTRPYNQVPSPQTVPEALFITAIDTEPFAADPASVLATREEDFIAGVEVLSSLPDGPTYLCKAPSAAIPSSDLPGRVEIAEFSGVHPAGLVGTHIHFLHPVNEDRTVWHINYQDVVAVGHLFLTGKLCNERVLSIAGPIVEKPRLVRTQLGANLSELTANEIKTDSKITPRVISGSVLSGRQSREPMNYLGRYHLQVSALAEGNVREFLGWMTLGEKKFSLRRVFASAFSSDTQQQFEMTTSSEGSPRAIVPMEMYEDVMPLDILATPLLKALIVGDVDYANRLGCLELDEEDLALCTFVCPGKTNFGPLLREILNHIIKEG